MQLSLSRKILFYIFLIIFLSSLNNKYFLKIELEPINKIKIIGLEETETQDLLNNFELLNMKNIFFLNKFELVKKLEDIDSKSWLLTAKLCSDEEHDMTEEDWYKRGKEEFNDKDWAAEVDSFRLNNEGAKESLIEFAESLF